MRRLGRKGRVLKWAGLVVSLLIAITFAVSLRLAWDHWKWWDNGPNPDGTRVFHLIDLHLGPGMIAGGYASGRGKSHFSRTNGWSVYGDNVRLILIWRPRFSSGRVGDVGCAVILPLWIPFVLVGVPTAVLFWRDRRIPAGHCQKCGYDLTGNVSGLCPECGAEVGSGQ